MMIFFNSKNKIVRISGIIGASAVFYFVIFAFAFEAISLMCSMR